MDGAAVDWSVVGCSGGTVLSAEMDLRPGGRWRWIFQAQGGPEVAAHGEYHELVPGGRIVTTQAIGDGAPAYRYTVTFADVDGGAEMTMLWQHPTKEQGDALNAAQRLTDEDAPIKGMIEALDELVRSILSGDTPHGAAQ